MERRFKKNWTKREGRLQPDIVGFAIRKWQFVRAPVGPFLKKAIAKVLSGGRSISGETAERLAFDVALDTGTRPHEKLSPREFEVPRLIVAGKAITEIADTLKVSLKTVSTFKRRILEKLEVNSTAALVRYAVKHRLVEP